VETTWTEVTWHHHYNYQSRQLISFLVSTVILLLILQIPMELYHWQAAKEPTIAVELVKVKPEIKKQIPETIEETQVIPVDSKPIPVIETIKKPKFIPTEIIHKEAKVITQKTKASTAKLPSSAVILNVMEQKPWLNKLDKDFQVATDDANDFKFKQIVKPQQKPLEFIDKNNINPKINIQGSLALKTLKWGIGYFIVPFSDREKTQDTLSYCPLLGRMSVYCPINSPLGN